MQQNRGQTVNSLSSLIFLTPQKNGETILKQGLEWCVPTEKQFYIFYPTLFVLIPRRKGKKKFSNEITFLIQRKTALHFKINDSVIIFGEKKNVFCKSTEWRLSLKYW